MWWAKMRCSWEDGWWWRMGMLCCAALLLLSTLKPAQSSEGRAEEEERAAANSSACKVYASSAFFFFFFFFTTKTTNSNHRLCRPTLELTPWRWRLRWTGRERIVTFKTVVARVVSSETAPMIRLRPTRWHITTPPCTFAWECCL